MQLIADRFAVDDRGHAIDLATGERVSVVVSTAGGPTEQARWAERCAWFAQIAHPSLAQLVDYGVLAETQRFEAWAAQSHWPGAAAAAEQALARACRFLVANGRSPGAGAVASIGCRAERPVLLPDASAGLPADVTGAAEVDADPALLGVLRHHDRRLAALGDIFSAGGTDRLPALALWAPEGGGMPAAVRVMARSARLAGYVPLNAALHSDAVRPLLQGRTLAVFAHDDVEGGWRAVLDAALDVSRPHIVIFAGAAPVRRVHTVPLERVRAEALQASVCPEAVAMKQRRAVATAARRAQGLAGRFEQLLFGQARAPVPAPAADRRRPSEAVRGGRGGRAAEQTTAFDEAHGMASRSDDSARRWPAPGEVTRLRRQLDAARAALRRGRCQPGERAARQAMHGFARRGEWLGALQCALCLIESLLRRGRLTDAEPLLDEARRWGSLARELGGLQRLSVLHAELLIASGRLPAAELLLETTLASAQSAGPEAPLDAALALASCLHWQGRYGDAWQRLVVLDAEPDLAAAARVRIGVVKSQVAIGRGRVADAVAEAARARESAFELADPELAALACQASAAALLAAGDEAQADATALAALQHARAAHAPALTLSVRLLRAEVARRRGERGPAQLLLARMSRVTVRTLPALLAARLDLLRDLLTAADPVLAAEQRADRAGLAALRLFAPARRPEALHAAPVADDIVELLRCCQAADEDAALLMAVCGRLRARLRAAGVAFFALEEGALVPAGGDGGRIDSEQAQRIFTAGQLVLPHHGGERVTAGVPVRYAGQIVGVLMAAWLPASTWNPSDVAVLLSTGATAAGPALSGVVARRRAERVPRTSELLGVSPVMAGVRAAVERAASAPFAVLVEGESGSGKELVARQLHKLGIRRDRPFCTLNCAALPEDLIESELFGHARGAFTGAAVERRGVFEEAHTGTLFLDEVGELSARAQAKLLRALQEGEIRRVGENVCRRVDVRLVTATNRNLRDEVGAGRFRLDLLYRLDVIRIPLPPLRERRDDIVMLAELFWRDAAERVGSRATLAQGTLAALARHDWPGNIRELQNVLASLVVRSPKRGVIPPSALPGHFGPVPSAAGFRLDTARRTFDRSFIQAALVRAAGHRTRAAEELGVSRQGLAKLMERLEIADGSAGTVGREGRD